MQVNFELDKYNIKIKNRKVIEKYIDTRKEKNLKKFKLKKHLITSMTIS